MLSRNYVIHVKKREPAGRKLFSIRLLVNKSSYRDGWYLICRKVVEQVRWFTTARLFFPPFDYKKYEGQFFQRTGVSSSRPRICPDAAFGKSRSAVSHRCHVTPPGQYTTTTPNLATCLQFPISLSKNKHVRHGNTRSGCDAVKVLYLGIVSYLDRSVEYIPHGKHVGALGFPLRRTRADGDGELFQ